MKIQAVVGITIGAIVIAGAAYAQIRPLGGKVDSFTFADGTVVQSAYVSSVNTGSINVLQIKKTNGDDCYAVVGSSGQTPAIDCLPQ
jgi:hypothetical protein